jgi:hypothetical protein
MTRRVSTDRRRQRNLGVSAGSRGAAASPRRRATARRAQAPSGFLPSRSASPRAAVPPTVPRPDRTASPSGGHEDQDLEGVVQLDGLELGHFGPCPRRSGSTGTVMTRTLRRRWRRTRSGSRTRHQVFPPKRAPDAPSPSQTVETAGIEPASAIAHEVASTSVSGALFSSRSRLAGGVLRDQPPEDVPGLAEADRPGLSRHLMQAIPAAGRRGPQLTA